MVIATIRGVAGIVPAVILSVKVAAFSFIRVVICCTSVVALPATARPCCCRWWRRGLLLPVLLHAAGAFIPVLVLLVLLVALVLLMLFVTLGIRLTCAIQVQSMNMSG